MVIRSQDGNFIVNSSAIDTFAAVKRPKDKVAIVAFCGAANTDLGLYSSERQAGKVMDGLEDALTIKNAAAYRLPDDDGPLYVCPNCHNTEHLSGAKFCMICGLAFPTNGGETNE